MSKEKWPDWDVYIRDAMACVYCGLNGRADFRLWQQLVIDHLIPRAQGGDDLESNKVVSCHRCNTLKQAQRLSTKETSPIDVVHRKVLIAEASQLIANTSITIDERDDYELILRETRERNAVLGD